LRNFLTQYKGASVNVEQALNTTELYAGLYLTSSSQWTITRLTSNTVYDGTPTVCGTTFNGDNLVAVVWQQGNFLHPQNIVLSIGVIGNDVAASTWIQPATIATNISGLSGLSCSWSQDTVAITYTQTNGGSAQVAMSLYVNENNTVAVNVPTLTDSASDSAPVQTLTVSGQFLSVWTHGSNILVASTLLYPLIIYSTSHRLT
jgi:hypothetical protein